MAQITIFLFFVTAVIITNTLMIWMGYRLFAGLTTKLTSVMDELKPGGAGRQWLENLEAASSNVAAATREMRMQLAAAEPALIEAHARLQFGLAKADVRMERLCNTVSKGTEIAQEALVRPSTRIGAIAAGVTQVLKLFVQNDFDATSTLRR